MNDKMWLDYQEFCLSTAKLVDKDWAMVALASELFELKEALDLELDDQFIIDELGDVLWYIGFLSNVLGVKLDLEPKEAPFEFTYSNLSIAASKLFKAYEKDWRNSNHSGNYSDQLNMLFDRVVYMLRDTYNTSLEEAIEMNRAKLNKRRKAA